MVARTLGARKTFSDQRQEEEQTRALCRAHKLIPCGDPVPTTSFRNFSAEFAPAEREAIRANGFHISYSLFDVQLVPDTYTCSGTRLTGLKVQRNSRPSTVDVISQPRPKELQAVQLREDRAVAHA